MTRTAQHKLDKSRGWNCCLSVLSNCCCLSSSVAGERMSQRSQLWRFPMEISAEVEPGEIILPLTSLQQKEIHNFIQWHANLKFGKERSPKKSLLFLAPGRLSFSWLRLSHGFRQITSHPSQVPFNTAEGDSDYSWKGFQGNLQSYENGIALED